MRSGEPEQKEKTKMGKSIYFLEKNICPPPPPTMLYVHEEQQIFFRVLFAELGKINEFLNKKYQKGWKNFGPFLQH